MSPAAMFHFPVSCLLPLLPVHLLSFSEPFPTKSRVEGNPTSSRSARKPTPGDRVGFLARLLYKLCRVACARCAHQSYRVYKIP